MGPHSSFTLSLSTGGPQGCVLSPFLYFLYTHDCIPACIFKFADDTTVETGLPTEVRSSKEVQGHSLWCTENILALNIKITDSALKDDAGWPSTTVSKHWLGRKSLQHQIPAQQQLFFLRTLRKAGLSQQRLSMGHLCSTATAQQLTKRFCRESLRLHKRSQTHSSPPWKASTAPIAYKKLKCWRSHITWPTSCLNSSTLVVDTERLLSPLSHWTRHTS